MASIFATFPIGDGGVGFATIEWTPDPEVLAQEILTMAEEFDDWSKPLALSRQLMIEDTELHFDTETDPFGEKWAPLKEKPAPKWPDQYKERKIKAGFPDEILVRTGALKNYATSEQAWFVDEHSIYFRAEGLPTDDKSGFPYGAAHQSGTTEHPFMQLQQRPLSSLSQKELTEIASGSNKGKNLPRRMFIGANEFTIELIQDVFVKHMERTIEEPWSRPINLPPPPSMGMTAGGQQFPIIKFTASGQPILRAPKGPRFGRRL